MIDGLQEKTYESDAQARDAKNLPLENFFVIYIHFGR